LNIKKYISLGLILILTFPMLYLPLSINNQGLAISSDMPYTYEEWREFLLSRYNLALEDIDTLDEENINSLNQEARVYQGWANGTYSDEQKDQLFLELHNTPLITTPLLEQWSDNYFKASFSVTNNFLNWEHVFRVYAYIDYNREADTDDGDKFHDGSSHKKRGSFRWCIPADDEPYTEVPFDDSLDPKESFMGERKKWTHDGQQDPIIKFYNFEWDNPLEPNHNPGPINIVIQVLWAHDTFDVWEWGPLGLIEYYKLCKYYRHFYWETIVYSYDFLTRNMEIYDDDPDPPVIPTENILPGYPFNPIDLPPIILDNMPTFPLEVCAYDLGTSDPHPYNAITFGSVNVYNGEYLSEQDELIEWGGILEDDIYAYWYKYDIPNNYEPGTHTLTLKVWDKDNDGWAGDRLSASHEVTFTVIDDDTTEPDVQFLNDWVIMDCDAHLEIIISATDPSGFSSVYAMFEGTKYTPYFDSPEGEFRIRIPNPIEPDTYSVDIHVWDNDNDGWGEDRMEYTTTKEFEVVDDDILGPDIDYPYTGDGTDGNSGAFEVTASDPSGLSVDPTGTYPVPNSLGTHEIPIVATDDDNDRPGDNSTTTLVLSQQIVDDDIDKPYIENLMTTVDHLWVNISFTAIDDLQLLGDGDEGLSNISVYLDGKQRYTGSSPSYETAFDLSFPNDWIWMPGSYEIIIYLMDADDDRPSDSLLTMICWQFEITLDLMYQYVMWLCEEMNNYIYDNDIVALYGVVTQKLVKIQSLLWEAYQLIQDGYLHTGLVRQKMAEIKLEIADTKTELMINKQSMSQVHFDHLKECIRDVRNRIVELMGLGISVFSHDISLVEVDVYNLRDFVEENIPAADSENLVNAITLTAEKLENAIFDISLDKSTERSLTSAQNALNNVWIQVIALAGKGKISEELKLDLVAIIIPIVAEIEELKLNI